MTVGEMLALGGWMMVPIVACSVVAAAVFLRKLATSPGPASEAPWIAEVFDRLCEAKIEEALSISEAQPHPTARVLAGLLATTLRRPDRAEAEAGRVGSLEVQRSEGQLGLLSFIAQVTPLLGLLGTVVGMVQLFWGLGAGEGVVGAAVSSGIWKALLTTAAGLSVAVPTLAAHAYLSSRSDRLRLELHDVVERALTALPATENARRAACD